MDPALAQLLVPPPKRVHTWIHAFRTSGDVSFYVHAADQGAWAARRLSTSPEPEWMSKCCTTSPVGLCPSPPTAPFGLVQSSARYAAVIVPRAVWLQRFRVPLMPFAVYIDMLQTTTHPFTLTRVLQGLVPEVRKRIDIDLMACVQGWGDQA